MEEGVVPDGFPKVKFDSEESLEILRTKRREILHAHVWEESKPSGAFHCPACGRVFSINDSDCHEILKSPCKEHRRRSIESFSPEYVMARWPALVAHMIAESLGYYTPSAAAHTLLHHLKGEQDWCEYVYTCHDRNPTKQIKKTIASRRYHTGYMASYKQALALVIAAVAVGREPTFASWF
jgi:hypothetical protein